MAGFSEYRQFLLNYFLFKNFENFHFLTIHIVVLILNKYNNLLSINTFLHMLQNHKTICSFGKIKPAKPKLQLQTCFEFKPRNSKFKHRFVIGKWNSQKKKDYSKYALNTRKLLSMILKMYFEHKCGKYPSQSYQPPTT